MPKIFPSYFFSRFDGVVVDSEEDVVDVGIGSDASIPPLELRLYNSIEITCMDLQYDPMTLLTRRPQSNSKETLLSENKRSGRKKKIVNPNIRSRRDIAVVDVHDEEPSFLEILPRNTPQDVSQGCEKKSCASLCQRH